MKTCGLDVHKKNVFCAVYNGKEYSEVKEYDTTTPDCDPPYFGRHVDYYNGWSEKDEENLFHLLKETKAKFILSTWHHNDWRENEMVKKHWRQFNILTKDHFYHNGGNIENRREVVEALVCNFDISNLNQHNHETKTKPKVKQLELAWE